MTPAIIMISANAIARAGLTRVLAAEGFVVTRSVAAVADLVLDQGEPGLAIIDGVSPEAQLASLRALLAVSSTIRPVVLTARFDFDSMVECFAAGAEGYLVKDMGVAALVGSLQLIARGQKVMPSALADELPLCPSPAKETRQAVGYAQLSPREHDTLCCLVAGHSNKAVARQLDITEATVKVHIKAVLRKLKVGNRTQAALWAVEQGIDLSLRETRHSVLAELAA